jgi:hypothetical protein
VSDLGLQYATDQSPQWLDMAGPSQVPQVQRQMRDAIHQPHTGKGKRPIKVSEKARQVIHIDLICQYVTSQWIDTWTVVGVQRELM